MVNRVLLVLTSNESTLDPHGKDREQQDRKEANHEAKSDNSCACTVAGSGARLSSRLECRLLGWEGRLERWGRACTYNSNCSHVGVVVAAPLV